ncbi:hypothetical protein [Desulfatiferula olefinivorans]
MGGGVDAQADAASGRKSAPCPVTDKGDLTGQGSGHAVCDHDQGPFGTADAVAVIGQRGTGYGQTGDQAVIGPPALVDGHMAGDADAADAHHHIHRLDADIGPGGKGERQGIAAKNQALVHGNGGGVDLNGHIGVGQGDAGQTESGRGRHGPGEAQAVEQKDPFPARHTGPSVHIEGHAAQSHTDPGLAAVVGQLVDHQIAGKGLTGHGQVNGRACDVKGLVRRGSGIDGHIEETGERHARNLGRQSGARDRPGHALG